MTEYTEGYAIQKDQRDPIGVLRAKFSIPGDNLLYLDGNSLGMLVHGVADDLRHTVEHEWGDRLIRSWNEGWYEQSEFLGDKIAGIAGAGKGEVVVADSTSVNLYKLARAALQLQKGRTKIITDNLNFPSDVYIFQGIIEEMGEGYELVILESEDGMTISPHQVQEAVDDTTALVSFSHVVFKSAFRYPMTEITEIVHRSGGLVLWDLSHSIGAVPVELNKAGADFAVGCTYKYLNGGPGSPAFLYVRSDLQDRLQSPVWGWFGESDPFDFDLSYKPARGIRRFLAGTPPILSMLPMERTLDMMSDTGMQQIWEKSMDQSEYFIALVKHFLTGHGFKVGSPMEPANRGSHVSLKHPEAYRICKALIDPANGTYQVVPDFREPDNIRIGITPLNTRYVDLYHAVQEMNRIMDAKDYLAYTADREAVT